MNGNNFAVALACCTGFASVASAAFVTPNSYGWSRGSTNSAYFEWNFFPSPTGPNSPDVGQFPNPLPTGWTPANVVENSGASFITGAGNIYSFTTPLDLDVNFPNYGRGAKWTTTVLVQTRTLGSELDYANVRIGSVLPLSRIELGRVALGGFGGFQVDTLFRFELVGNLSNYEFDLHAAESSMSLDMLAIDTLTRVRGLPYASAAPLNMDCPDCLGTTVPGTETDVPSDLIPSPGVLAMALFSLPFAAHGRRRK